VVGDIPRFQSVALPTRLPVVLSGALLLLVRHQRHIGDSFPTPAFLPHLAHQIHCVSYLDGRTLAPAFFPSCFYRACFLSWSSVGGTELFWEERFSAYPKHRSTLQSASAALEFDVVFLKQTLLNRICCCCLSNQSPISSTVFAILQDGSDSQWLSRQ